MAPCNGETACAAPCRCVSFRDEQWSPSMSRAALLWYSERARVNPSSRASVWPEVALRKAPPSGHPAVSCQCAAPTSRWPASADPQSRHGVAHGCVPRHRGKIAIIVQIARCCSCSCCLSRIGSKRDATELHGTLRPVQRQFLALGKGVGSGQIDRAKVIRYQHEVGDRTRSSVER